MVNFSFLCIVLVGILFLVVPTYQRGNLNADTIYSSSETFITIDTLEGGNVEVTNIKTDTVAFGNFDTVSLEAQAINLDGSFALLEATNNIDLQSSNGTAGLLAGNDLNINAENIAISSNGGSVNFSSEQGELHFVAGNQFTATSDSFSIKTEVGGALLNSQGGDIDINSSGDLIINSNDKFNIRSTHDILLTTPSDIDVASTEGEITVASLHDVHFNAENSIGFTSNGELISFNAGDFIISNTQSFSANGGNELKIQSFTSSIKFNSFGVTSFASNSDLTVQGDTKGISLFSTGENTGIIQLTSQSRSVLFTAQGHGDTESGLLANVDSFEGTVSGASKLLSKGDGVIRSNGDISITSGSSFSIDTENVNIHTARFDTTSDLNFVLAANNINLYAFDDASSGNTLGHTEINANNVQFIADNDVVIHGGDLSFTAGDGDLALSAGDILVRASRGDNGQHSITVNGTNFQFSGDSARVFGGDVDVFGDSLTVDANDVTYNSLTLAHNFVRHTASDDIVVKLEGDSQHNTQELTFFSFYAGGDSSQSGIVFDSSETIYASTYQEEDITLVSKTYFEVKSLDNVVFSSLDTDIEVVSDFSAYGDNVQVSANDFSATAYSLSFDSLDSDPTTGNQNIEFTAGSKSVFSTPRNENGDDSITASYANVTLTQEELFFTGLYEGNFNTETFNILSNQITLSSDDRENINFNINSLSLTAELNLEYKGDSVTFSAADEAEINVSDDFIIENDDRGSLFDSQGSFSLSVGEDLSVGTPDSIFVQSGDSATFNTAFEFDVESLSVVDIYSTEGPVDLSSEDLFSVNSANNIMFNTGDHEGNLFSTNSENLILNANDVIATGVSSGNLDINVAEDSVLTAENIAYVGAGVVNVDSVTYSLDTAYFDVLGGNIDIISTDGDITFDASNLHISSFEASLAGQEVDRITYEILFSSGDEIVILTDVDGELSSKSDNLVIEALKPEGGEEGEIFVAGSDILITSELTNQFIQFTSGGLINITANTNAVVGSDGDFFVHTANSAQFYAESIAQSMGESITFDAQTNSCVNITHIGNNLEFTVDSAIPRFYNDLEFKATDFVYFQAGDGAINILANGASTKRQNEDGNSNGDLIFNQEISASLRSRAEQGNIIFEAQDDVVSLDAGLNTIIATLQQALFYTLTGQSYSAGTNTKFESESGNVTMRAGHDYSITASGSLFFAATQNTTVLAEDYIYVDATANIAVTSNSGDIFFNTYNNNDININGASSVSFTSGASGSRFIAHGDITTLTSTYELQSARGINLLTNNGPILFSSLGATSLESSEELFVKSGHNALTTSTNSTAFNGNGIVFGSSAADVLIQSAEDVLVSSKTAILQSLGTSQSSRDRVAFNSKDITFQSLTAHVDATELVQIGKTTLPIVTITASGTDAISGVVIDVAASTEIITEGKLVYSSVLGENDISATSVATFNADGAINIDNSNFNIFTLEGSVSLSANNATDIDVDISASFESNHFLKFTSSASQPTQGIEFESNSFELSGHFLNSQVDNLYSVLATDYALSSLEQGGGVIFEAPKGTIEINTKDNALFGASRDLSLTAGADALFSADMLKFATSSRIGSTPITFQAQHTIDITSALTASFTGDYVALSTYGPGADILYTAENLKIASSSGSFISNSTLGSQNFEPDSIEMNIDNFVIFDAASIDFLVNGGKATGISVSSLVGTFNAATQFSLDAETSIDINADGMLSFIAADSLRFDVAAGDVLDLTFTAEDIILTTNNDLNNILIHSLGKVTATGYSINFRAGSEQEREDFRILAGKVTTGANNVQTSFIAQPTGVRVASPVSVSYPTITFNSEYITFNSTSDKEGFGGIYIGSPALDNDITVDADESIVFLSESARILTQVAGSITFDGPQMLMNTNGLDAVIRFDSQTSTTIACDDINLFSKDHTKFMSEADDFTLGAETSFTVVVNGPNDGNGNGIVVTGVQSVAIDTVDDFVATADATRFSALTGITINSPTVSFEGSSVLVKAHGGRENSPASGPFYDAYFGVQKDFVGINIDSPDLNVESPDGQLTMQSAILFHSSTDAFIADVDLNVQYTAGENFEISAAQQTTLTVDDFLLHAKKGITLQLATGIEFEATTIVAQAGNDDPDAKIIFSSNDISFDSVTSINLKSYDTIQYESASNIVTNADTSISFEASRGDILFRSISVTNVHDQETNDFDVEITSIDINLYAGRSIRHIDHWGLGFFNIASQTGRSGAPLNIAGSLVTESNANWAANIACVCGGGGRNCECPNAVNRVVQLYTAFLNYGLIKIVTP